MFSATYLLVLSLSLAVTCTAYSTFTTTCTTPPPNSSLNFISSPDSRGTLDILWSCLFTIIACTWTIQHLNLPEQRPRKARRSSNSARYHGTWCDVKWALKDFWTNFKWMLFTMVAPEFILGKAMGDLVAAWDNRERMREYAEADDVDWGLAHAFYANMGGFVGVSEEKVLAIDDYTPLVADDIYWLRSKPRSEIASRPISTEIVTVAGLDDNERVGEGKGDAPKEELSPIKKKLKTKLEKLPNLTFAELGDKSKGNIFVKMIAVVQVSWVAIQIIVRLHNGLSISQLELAVAAFSICAIITYILLIPKPQGIKVVSRPLACEGGSMQEAASHNSVAQLREMFVPGFQASGAFTKRIPNDAMYAAFDKGRFDGKAYFLGFIIGGMVFGGIHVAGWNLVFPTPIERKLWRISSILLTAIMPAVFTHLMLASESEWVDRVVNDYQIIIQTWDGVLGVLYIAARLFILVEIFRTLLFLPPDAYISTWASDVPHVG